MEKKKSQHVVDGEFVEVPPNKSPQNDVSRMIWTCVLGIGACITLLVVILTLISVLGNLHTFIESANGFIQTVFHLLLPATGVATAAIVGQRIHKYLEDHKDRSAARQREDKLTDAQVKLLEAEAETRARFHDMDSQGNKVYFDPTTGRVELLLGHMREYHALGTLHNHNVVHGATKVTEEKAPPKVLPAPSIEPPRDFPEQFDLLEVFRRSHLSPENIFLGKGNGSAQVWVDAQRELCHGIFSASTGRGKTIIERGIETQLLACGLQVIHLDLKFTLIDENGLDYRPLAKHLLAQPAIQIAPGVALPHLVTDMRKIYTLLKWLATVEIPCRLKMYHAGDHSYPMWYVFLEELLYLMSKYPDAAGLIGDIVVVGRSLGIKLFTAAQNFQAQNTNINGGMSENFETAYYCGGDDFSGAKVLDVSQRDLKSYLAQHRLHLGKSLALLRNNTVAPQATLTRVGMASNEAVYYLLGRADDFTLHGARALSLPFNGDSGGFHGLSALSSPLEQTAFAGPSQRNTGNLETDVKALENDVESIPAFSEDDERQIMSIARVHLATYGRVIRSKIPEAMQPRRNNAIYPVVKYICDREGW